MSKKSKHVCSGEKTLFISVAADNETILSISADGHGAEVCRKRWKSRRDSFNKARNQRKTKSGSAASTLAAGKYRWYQQLKFLLPALEEGP